MPQNQHLWRVPALNRILSGDGHAQCADSTLAALADPGLAHSYYSALRIFMDFWTTICYFNLAKSVDLGPTTL